MRLEAEVASLCASLGRNPQEITIVAVSKNRGVGEVREVLAAGISDIGENRVQEALLKYNELRTMNHELRTIKWHMVGHLQSNKVKDAVRIFDLIQSVDSLRLAEEIDKQAARINKIQDVMIEVKTSEEATKFGIAPDKTFELVNKIQQLKNIKISGLMTIAPLAEDPQEGRPYFRRLRDLLEEMNELRAMSYEPRTLSMGMSDDYRVAIEEGANMLRIGRAIFE